MMRMYVCGNGRRMGLVGCWLSVSTVWRRERAYRVQADCRSSQGQADGVFQEPIKGYRVIEQGRIISHAAATLPATSRFPASREGSRDYGG